MTMTTPEISPALAVALCEDRYTGTDAYGDNSWLGAPEGARCAYHEAWAYCWDRVTSRLSAQHAEGHGAMAHGHWESPAREWEAL